MNLLALTTFIAGIIYIYLAVYGLRMKPRTRLNAIFIALCLACALWAFCIAFMYNANKSTAWLLFRMSAPAWCLGPPLLLHFALVLTKNTYTPKIPYLRYLIYVPALIFAYIGMTQGLIATSLTYEVFGWSPVNSG